MVSLRTLSVIQDQVKENDMGRASITRFEKRVMHTWLRPERQRPIGGLDVIGSVIILENWMELYVQDPSGSGDWGLVNTVTDLRVSQNVG
jgi:hypothetical protein